MPPAQVPRRSSDPVVVAENQEAFWRGRSLDEKKETIKQEDIFASDLIDSESMPIGMETSLLTPTT